MLAQQNAVSKQVTAAGTMTIPPASWKQTPNRKYCRGQQSYLFDHIFKYDASVNGYIRVFIEYDVTFHVPQLQPESMTNTGPCVITADSTGRTETSAANTKVEDTFNRIKVSAQFASKILGYLSPDAAASNDFKKLKIFYSLVDKFMDSGDEAISITRTPSNNYTLKNDTESTVKFFANQEDASQDTNQLLELTPHQILEDISLYDKPYFVADLANLAKQVLVDSDWLSDSSFTMF